MNAPAFWIDRSPRERAVLGWVAATAVALLVFAFVWLPLERAGTRVSAGLPQLRASVAEMRAQAVEVRALRAIPERDTAAVMPLATLIASGTLTQGIPGARLSLLDGKRVKLAVGDASWARLVEWLSAAHATHGLVVEEATVETLATAGRVRADFVLAAP